VEAVVRVVEERAARRLEAARERLDQHRAAGLLREHRVEVGLRRHVRPVVDRHREGAQSQVPRALALLTAPIVVPAGGAIGTPTVLSALSTLSIQVVSAAPRSTVSSRRAMPRVALSPIATAGASSVSFWVACSRTSRATSPSGANSSATGLPGSPPSN